MCAITIQVKVSIEGNSNRPTNGSAITFDAPVLTAVAPSNLPTAANLIVTVSGANLHT